MNKTFGLVAAFFAGLGLGFLLFADPREQASPTQERSTVEVRQTDGSRTTPPRVESASTTENQSSPPLDPRPATITGDGVISGRIWTRLRDPLEGALIVATAQKGADASAMVSQARSSTDGTFRLERLLDRTYAVEAHLGGFQLEPVDAEAAAASSPGAIVDFVADRLVPFPLDVTTRDGRTVFEARIEWTSVRERRRAHVVDLKWTKGEGKIELPPGRHTIRAFDPDDPGIASRPARVWIEHGAKPEPLELILERRLGIRGRILVDAGEEPEEVRVDLLRWDEVEPPSRKLVIAAAEHCEATRSSGYAYVFEDLPPGRYWVAATRFSDRAEVEEFVEIRGEPIKCNLSLPPLDVTDYVTVHVLGPGGEPLTDIGLSQKCKTERSSSSRSANAFVLRDGSFAVLPDLERRPCDARDARHLIEVRSRIFGSREVEYHPGSREPVIVSFDDLAWLTVELEGDDSHADVHLFEMHLDAVGASKSRTGSASRLPDGSFEFASVEPGSYEIVFMLQTHVDWGSRGGSEVLRHAVELRAGQNHTTLSAPRLHDLTVVVPDARGETRIDLRRRDPDGRGWSGVQLNNRPVGADGQVRFEGIPSGKYALLSAEGYDEGEMDIELASDMVVHYEPRPYTALRVRIVEEGTALAAGGLKEGDLIVSLDDEVLPKGRERLRDALRALRGRDGQVVCGVLRGNQTLRLAVDARVLAQRDFPRAWVSPAAP